MAANLRLDLPAVKRERSDPPMQSRSPTWPSVIRTRRLTWADVFLGIYKVRMACRDTRAATAADGSPSPTPLGLHAVDRLVAASALDRDGAKYALLSAELA